VPGSHGGRTSSRSRRRRFQGEITQVNKPPLVPDRGRGRARQAASLMLGSGEPPAGERTCAQSLKSDAKSTSSIHFLRPPERSTDGTADHRAIHLSRISARELFQQTINDFQLSSSTAMRARAWADHYFAHHRDLRCANGGAVLVAAGPTMQDDEPVAARRSTPPARRDPMVSHRGRRSTPSQRIPGCASGDHGGSRRATPITSRHWCRFIPRLRRHRRRHGRTTV